MYIQRTTYGGGHNLPDDYKVTECELIQDPYEAEQLFLQQLADGFECQREFTAIDCYLEDEIDLDALDFMSQGTLDSLSEAIEGKEGNFTLEEITNIYNDICTKERQK